MRRIVVNVPDHVISSLDQVAWIEKRSRASLIRDAIAEYVRLKSLPSMDAAFGLWKEKGSDGLQYQRNLRDEWQG